LADKLTKQFAAEISLIPSAEGVFEVVVNGTLIYSKKVTGEFPDEIKLCQQIAKL
jgi:selT/selW/selH-like putative selenoprotein